MLEARDAFKIKYQVLMGKVHSAQKVDRSRLLDEKTSHCKRHGFSFDPMTKHKRQF